MRPRLAARNDRRGRTAGPPWRVPRRGSTVSVPKTRISTAEPVCANAVQKFPADADVLTSVNTSPLPVFTVFDTVRDAREHHDRITA